jgi:hypothetical protein
LVLRIAFKRASGLLEVSSVKIRVTTVSEVFDRRHRIVRTGIDHFVGAERFGALQPLLADVERDYLGAHRLGVLRGRKSNRALAENR